jgi:hypothetical protein
LVRAKEWLSFMTKFKDLWLAGHNASLLFETQAGEASATLRVALGAHPRKLHHPQQSPQETRHVTPSQQRRLERREFERRRAAEEAANTEVAEETTDHVAAEATDPVAEKVAHATILTAGQAVSGNTNDDKLTLNSTPTEEVVDVSKLKTAEKSEPDDFACDLCERTFDSLKGLRTHTGRQNKVSSSPIPQVDGLTDIHEPNYCKVCEECPDEIVTSEDVSYHVMNDHEVFAVREKYGNEWIKEKQYCIRRGSPFEPLHYS